MPGLAAACTGICAMLKARGALRRLKYLVKIFLDIYCIHSHILLLSVYVSIVLRGFLGDNRETKTLQKKIQTIRKNGISLIASMKSKQSGILNADDRF